MSGQTLQQKVKRFVAREKVKAEAAVRIAEAKAREPDYPKDLDLPTFWNAAFALGVPLSGLPLQPDALLFRQPGLGRKRLRALRSHPIALKARGLQ